MKPDPTPMCSYCGKPIAEGDQAIRFELPDAVLRLPTSSYVYSDDEPIRADWLMARVDGVERFFTRALLDHGRICAWMETDEATQKAMGVVWNKPKEYMKLRAVGQLANAVPPWGDAVLGAECTVAPRKAGHLPYVSSSTNPTLRKALEAGNP